MLLLIPVLFACRPQMKACKNKKSGSKQSEHASDDRCLIVTGVLHEVEHSLFPKTRALKIAVSVHSDSGRLAFSFVQLIMVFHESEPRITQF